MSSWAIVVAGGRGTRMGEGCPKQFRLLGARRMYEYSLRALGSEGVDGIVLVVPEEMIADIRHAVSHTKELPVVVCSGGVLRRDSVRSGFTHIPTDVEIVAIHDAARPLLPRSVIRSVRTAAAAHGAAVAVLPVTDTLKQGSSDGRIVKTVDRSVLYRAQTPQAFRRELLGRILIDDAIDGLRMTDEAMGAELLGHQPAMVDGSPFCFKITTSDDFSMAEAVIFWLLTHRRDDADWSWL